MSKFYNSFDFIGELFIPNDDSKFLDIKDNGAGWLGHRLNFGIKESKFNSAFLELYGGYRNKDNATNLVYTFSQGSEGKKGSPIQIPWDIRLDKSTLDMVADFRKIIVDLETDFDKKDEYMKLGYQIRKMKYEGVETDEDKEELAKLEKKYGELATNRHEFISEYDAILFLSAKLKEFKDHKFRIKGVPVLNEWKGKYYKKFEPQAIEIVPETYTNQLKITADVFFFKDCLDKTSMKEGKIYVDGYLQDYVRESKRDELFPQTFVINTGKLDMDNEQHLALLKVMESQFDVKGRNLYHLPWEINFYRGAEKIEDKSLILTDEQKALIRVGIAEEKDFNTSGFGENIEEFRLAKPLLVDAFSTGALDTGFKESEALDLVCATSADVKIEDVVSPKKEDSPTEEMSDTASAKEIADTIEDLFG